MWKTYSFISLLWNLSRADCRVTLYVYDMLTALITYLKKYPCGAFRCRLRLVVFFLPTLWSHLPPSPVTIHSFIIYWVIFKIHPYVISTFMTTKPLWWNCRHPGPVSVMSDNSVTCWARCTLHARWWAWPNKEGCSSRYYLGFNWQITRTISRNVMDFKRLTDHPLTFTSILVNENSHKSHVLVIKEPCLSLYRLVIVMKRSVNEIISSSLTKTTLPHVQRRGFPTITWCTLKSRKRFMHKNIRMYESVHTHESKHISFVHPNQRGIERTCRSTRLLPVHAPT